LLGEMCGKEVERWRGSGYYFNELKKKPKIVLIDEVHELLKRKTSKEVLPRMKELMDEGSNFILLGLDTVPKDMNEDYHDLRDRFLSFSLVSLTKSDTEKAFPDFDGNALKIIHGQNWSMRSELNVIKKCMQYIKNKGLPKVTEEIAEELIGKEGVKDVNS